MTRREDPPQGAEIVVEVLSPGQSNRERDLVKKRTDYAKARIPEYGIVDPEQSRVTVLTLRDEGYAIHGEFTSGLTASSDFLPEFSVNVSELFASAQTAS